MIEFVIRQAVIVTEALCVEEPVMALPENDRQYSLVIFGALHLWVGLFQIIR